MKYDITANHWTSSDGTEYIVISDNTDTRNTLYDTKEYTEAQAIQEHKEMLIRKEIKNMIRSVAHRLSDEDYYKMKDELNYIFTFMAAYGDESYYINSRDGKYYYTWFYIGD